MSPFFCTKDKLLDWTEITKSGTRQNQKNKPKTRQKFQLYYHFFHVLNLPHWSHYCRLFVLEKSKQVMKELLQKN